MVIRSRLQRLTSCRMGIFVCVLFTCLALHCSKTRSMDPYDLVERNCQALGGLEAILAMRTSLSTGEFFEYPPGDTGTFTAWTKWPTRYRMETRMPGQIRNTGDNGSVSWVYVDGSLTIDTIDTDSALIAERLVDSLVAVGECLNRESALVKLTYGGIGQVEGVDCYIVEAHYSFTDDTYREFYDTSTLLSLQSQHIMNDVTSTTKYMDYRPVDGVLVAYQTEIEIGPPFVKWIFWSYEIEFNVPLHDSLFRPPAIGELE